MSCSECNVISFYFMCGSVNGSVCLVCCKFVSVCSPHVFFCVIVHTIWSGKSRVFSALVYCVYLPLG